MIPLIDARNVSKRFLLRHGSSGELKVRVLNLLRRRRVWVEEFWALRAVSLRIGPGEAVGLVGRNGSGKSTLLKLIAGLHRPTSGELLVRRDLRLGTIIELGVGFHGELSGRENVFLNAALYGMSRDAIEARYAAIVAYAELEHFMDVPLKSYSSGMQMRLAFAVAATLDPEVLLIDEIFAVGDQNFQQKCIATLKAFQRRGGTMIFVSHAPSAVQALCERVAVLDRGEVSFDGPAKEGLASYAEQLRAAPEESDGERQPGFRAQAADVALPEDRLDQAWHRTRLGGAWAAGGTWAVELLAREGLRPSHFLLELGCGSLAAGREWLQRQEQSRYWGFELNRDLLFDGITIELPRVGAHPERGHFVVNRTFDLSSCPHRFDFIVASSLFARMPLHGVAKCLAAALPLLAPGGRFYATWMDVEHALLTPRAPAAHDTMSYADAEPYHHDFATIAALAASLGGRAERVTAPAHPRGESVLVVTM